LDQRISAAEANRSFSKLLREVRQGRSYMVTADGEPVARIVPVTSATVARQRARILCSACCKPDRSLTSGAGAARTSTARRDTGRNILAYAEGVNGARNRTTAALVLLRQIPSGTAVLPAQSLGELFNVPALLRGESSHVRFPPTPVGNVWCRRGPLCKIKSFAQSHEAQKSAEEPDTAASIHAERSSQLKRHQRDENRDRIYHN
jgi:prevent-host-death family protein